MTHGDDRTVPLTDTSDLGKAYDNLDNDGEPTALDDWKAMNVEDSPVVWMNQFLNGRPLEDFNPFILTADLDSENEKDAYPGDYHSIDFSLIVWSLLLKEAQQLLSDERLEFCLKSREDVAQMAGFDSIDDVPRNTTLSRACADTDPTFDGGNW